MVRKNFILIAGGVVLLLAIGVYGFCSLRTESSERVAVCSVVMDTQNRAGRYIGMKVVCNDKVFASITLTDIPSFDTVEGAPSVPEQDYAFVPWVESEPQLRPADSSEIRFKVVNIINSGTGGEYGAIATFNKKTRAVRILNTYTIIKIQNSEGQTTDLLEYTNKQQGFSILVPKVVQNGIPVQVIPSENSSTVTIKYDRDVWTGLNWNWTMEIRDVDSPDALPHILDDVIFRSYTPLADGECSIASFKSTMFKDTYDIVLTGAGGSKNNGCDSGSVWYIKYSPTLRKVAIWDAGQNTGFYVSKDGHDTVYDKIMGDSFHFVTK